MPDLNYSVPGEVAMAWKKFCEVEGLTQRVAIQWACHHFMQLDLVGRRKLLDEYNTWAEIKGDPAMEKPKPVRVITGRKKTGEV